MSMFMCVVRVTPAAFKSIKKDPSMLEGVFDKEAKVMKQLGIKAGDSAGFDYRIAGEMLDEAANLALLEGDGDGGAAESVEKNLGTDGKLAYDAGYGPAFTLSPKAVKKAAKHSSVIWIDKGVEKLFKAAAKRGDHIICIVT